MARQQHLGETEDIFIGEDKTIPFEIYASDEEAIENVATFAMAFYIRQVGDSDKRLLTKTTGGSTITITGSHNSSPTTNTQRTNVLIEDTDTDHWQPGNYSYSLWRTDAGNETVLAYGLITFKKAA